MHVEPIKCISNILIFLDFHQLELKTGENTTTGYIHKCNQAKLKYLKLKLKGSS